MLSYSFDHHNRSALYEQLYDFIRSDIEKGVLLPHTKLPSKRAFASHLGISTITIENAYSQLLSEGYLYSLPRKGYYVSDISADGNLPWDEGNHRLLPETGLQAQSDCPAVFADFSSNQTRPENFPFSIWAKLIRKVLSDHNQDLMTRSPGGGILPLRQALAGHLKQFRGMDVSPEQIILGAGTEYLYGLLIQLLGFHKTYAIEDPGYVKIGQIYDSYQVKKRAVPMDRQGIRMDRLRESGANVVHISPSHHFPTGIITPVSRRNELLAWTYKDPGRYIIEDDYDSEFRLTGKPIPSLQSIDRYDRVIYMNTFSKSLASTMRIAYMILPQALLTRFQTEMNFYSCTVSSFEQFVLMEFIENGYFEKHINRMRNYYHRQRDLLLEAIKNSPLSSLVRIAEEDAGLHFLMTIHTDLPDRIIMKRARKEGILLQNLGSYYQNAPLEAEHTFIINYSYVKPDRLEEAVRRLYHCLDPR